MAENKTLRKKSKTTSQPPVVTDDSTKSQPEDICNENEKNELETTDKENIIRTLENDTTWHDLQINGHLTKVLQDLNLPIPNPLQYLVNSVDKRNDNLLIHSMPGSGKTTSALLRILQNTKSDDFGVSTIYIVPTLETGYLIEQRLNSLSSYTPSIKSVLYTNYNGEEDPITQLCDLDRNLKSLVLILTPVLLLKAIGDNMFKWESVKNIVFDNLDRMLYSEKTAHHIETIFENPTRNKVITAFTSKKTKLLEVILNRCVLNLKTFTMDNANGDKFLNSKFEFYSLQVKELEKYKRLIKILETIEYSKCVVLLNSSQRTKTLADILTKREGISCVSLHCRIIPKNRIKILKNFLYNKSSRILICTFSIGHSLSMDGIDVLVNYDMSRTPRKKDEEESVVKVIESYHTAIDDFIVKVRTTGRTTDINKIYNFVTSEQDHQFIEELKDKLKIEFNEIDDEEE